MNSGERAAGGDLPPPPGGKRALERVQRVYAAYIKAAIIIALTAGSLWGLHLISWKALGKPLMVSWTEAHGHAQFFGWVALMVLGVSIFSLPRFTRANFSRISHLWAILWLLVGGIVLRVAAQQMVAGVPEAAWALRLAGVAELVAIGWFVWLVARLTPRTGTLEVPEYFTIAAYGFLLAAAGLNLWGTEQIIASAAQGTGFIQPWLNERTVFLLTWGFAGNIICGVGIRMLPPLLGLEERHPDRLRLSFFTFNAGLLAWLLVPSGYRVAGGVLLLGGGMLFISGLRVFSEGERSLRNPFTGRALKWFVRSAFGFMLLALAGEVWLGVLALQSGDAVSWNLRAPVLHTAALGFISTMIIGVGSRILPDFAGNEIYSEKLTWVAFWHIVPGTAIRTAAELAGTGEGVWQWVATGGAILQFGAIAIFGVNVWLTFAGIRRFADELNVNSISPDTKLAQLLEEFPEAREKLEEIGLEKAAALMRVPDRFTLGYAAEVEDLDPERIAARLREELTRAG